MGICLALGFGFKSPEQAAVGEIDRKLVLKQGDLVKGQLAQTARQAFFSYQFQHSCCEQVGVTCWFSPALQIISESLADNFPQAWLFF